MFFTIQYSGLLDSHSNLTQERYYSETDFLPIDEVTFIPSSNEMSWVVRCNEDPGGGAIGGDLPGP